MKKLLLFTVCAMLFATSCDNDNWFNGSRNSEVGIDGNGEESENEAHKIYDGLPPSPHFAIVDENDTLVDFEISEIEFVFDGVTYKYKDETRAIPPVPLGVYERLFGYCVAFGSLHVYDKGVFEINYRDQHWEVEFAFIWPDPELPYEEQLVTYTLTIDGEHSEPEEIAEVIYYYGNDEQQLVKIDAHKLRLK